MSITRFAYPLPRARRPTPKHSAPDPAAYGEAATLTKAASMRTASGAEIDCSNRQPCLNIPILRYALAYRHATYPSPIPQMRYSQRQQSIVSSEHSETEGTKGNQLPESYVCSCGILAGSNRAVEHAPASAAIHAGDKLNVYVYNHPEISTQVTVDSLGRISLPIAGLSTLPAAARKMLKFFYRLP